MLSRSQKKQNRQKGRKSGQNSTSVSAFHTRCRANILKYSGSFYMNPALISGANVFGLNPSTLGTSFSPSLLNIASCFMEFRFTRLDFRCFPALGANGDYSISYNPEVQTVPITITNALQSPYSLLVPKTATSMVPTELSLSRSVLMSGAAKWWKTVPSGSADDWDELQGQIDIIGLAAGSIQIEVYYTLELTGLSNSSTNLAPVLRRSLVKADQRAIDLFVPGKPFVLGKTIDEELLRVKTIGDSIDGPIRRDLAKLHLCD